MPGGRERPGGLAQGGIPRRSSGRVREKLGPLRELLTGGQKSRRNWYSMRRVSTRRGHHFNLVQGPWSSTMRYIFAALLLTALCLTDVAIAQTAAPTTAAPSRRALRQQDRQVCTELAAQQKIVRRNLAEFMRKCLADRQGARRAATK